MTEKIDSLLPPEIALQAEHIGVLKASMPYTKTFVLAMLAGAFIAFGSVFYITVTSGAPSYWGFTKLIGGVAFSLGLVLVIVGGAELFTGNNLIIMAWANNKVSTSQLLKNWTLVYVGNMVGALFITVLMFFSKQYMAGKGMVGVNLLNIANTKCELGFNQAIALGVLCNIMVCLAVWLSFSSNSISGKILAIIFPVSAFVAAGFEHSVANMYLIPEAILLRNYGDPVFLKMAEILPQNYGSVTLYNFIATNLFPVTIGNIIGGAVLVGMVYWFVYLRKNSGNK